MENATSLYGVKIGSQIIRSPIKRLKEAVTMKEVTSKEVLIEEVASQVKEIEVVGEEETRSYVTKVAAPSFLMINQRKMKEDVSKDLHQGSVKSNCTGL
jgi:hypothetical protein